MVHETKDARQGCNRGRANAISNEELNTFGWGLVLALAGFFALVLADMGAWWATAAAAACAVGAVALLARKE